MTLGMSTALLLFGFLPFRLIAAENPKMRVLPPEITEAFCRGQFDLKTLWAAKIFDVQVEGRRLKNQIGGREISEKLLKERSKSLALDLNFHGFSFGACPPNAQGGGWIAVFPSATPIEINGNAIRVSEKTGCKSHLTGARVAELRGPSTVLPDLNRLKNDSVFELPKDQTGFFTLECPSQDGIAQEFYFGPIGAPSSKVPYGSTLEAVGGSEINKVIEWINLIRLEHGLQALNRSSALVNNSLEAKTTLKNPKNSEELLMQAARDLTSSGRVQHSGKMLTYWKNKLAEDHIQLVGENRSRGATLSEAAFLLWASPRHRDLLLSERVNVLGIDVVTSRDGVLLGILAGMANDQKTVALPGVLSKSTSGSKLNSIQAIKLD